MKPCEKILTSLLFVACVSCGGGSGNLSGGEALPSTVMLSEASGFNGNPSPLGATPMDTTFAELVTTFTRTESNRMLRLWLPTGQIRAGQTITIDGTPTANALYEEQSGSETKAWLATGVASFSSGPNGTVGIDVDLAFSPDTSLAQNAATGTFAVKGRLKSLPDPYRPGQTKIAVAITKGAGYSGTTAPFPATALVGAGQTAQKGLRIAVSTQDPSFRALEAQTDLHNAGETATLAPGNNHDFLVYTESTATATKAWRSVSGTLKLAYIKYLGGKITLSGVRFEPDPSVPDNAAAGTFVLNGSLEKG